MKLSLLAAAVSASGMLLCAAPAFAAETINTIAVGPADPLRGGLYVHAGKLFFTTHDAQGDLMLAVSDGTAAGTKTLVKLASRVNGTTQQPRVQAMRSSPAGMLVIAEDFLIPGGTFPRAGEKLWLSDGTVAGTTLVTTLPRDAAAPSSPVDFTMEALGAKTLLARRTIAGTPSRTALLTTDGTAAGTVELAPALRPDTYAVPGAVFFVGLDGEVHRTDGQSDTTPFTFADRAPGQPTFLAVCNSALYVTYRTSSVRWRMMRYDGLSAPAEVGVLPADASATPGGVCANGTYYFFPYQSSIGREPWVVEGGSARLLADASPGNDSFTWDTYNAPVALSFGSRLVMPGETRTATNLTETRLYFSNASNTAMQKISNDDARYFGVLGTAGGRLYYTLGLSPSVKVFSTDGVSIDPVATGSAGPPESGGAVLGSKLVGWAPPSGSPAQDALWILDTAAPTAPPPGSGPPGSGSPVDPGGAPGAHGAPTGDGDVGSSDSSNGDAPAGQSGCAVGALRGDTDGLAAGLGLLTIALVFARRAHESARRRKSLLTTA